MRDNRNALHDPGLNRALLERVLRMAAAFREQYGRKPVFMEVCGSHTMALARSGLKLALKEAVTLVSGPGCPVCVTDQSAIDAMIGLAEEDNRILCTFGDMMRVPGSRGTLQDAKARGRDIRVVYAPLDAVDLAIRYPEREVVFLGIGFETTIPVLGAALLEADRLRLPNFSLWLSGKLVEPILRHLLELREVALDGFLLPGHVSVITGSAHFAFLPEEFGLSGVISGFEPLELVRGIHRLLELAVSGRKEIVNDHPSAVTVIGNVTAQRLMDRLFQPAAEEWRGIGTIAASGLAIREEYGYLDAKRKFQVRTSPAKPTGCRCGEVIRGVLEPSGCPLFGKACTPVNPVGPCMVSGEGSCAAEYHYMREG
ncbi:hydrogenase formation protein HypD [Gorillibacterium sp. sgz5001074]|uniref:hydrogenase formation protein HypD n=1 Tax=Gorillibacterium sp. sgz5001074 TaxID=3446695 RepID=UPI003F66BFF5